MSSAHNTKEWLSAHFEALDGLELSVNNYLFTLLWIACRNKCLSHHLYQCSLSSSPIANNSTRKNSLLVQRIQLTSVPVSLWTSANAKSTVQSKHSSACVDLFGLLDVFLSYSLKAGRQTNLLKSEARQSQCFRFWTVSGSRRTGSVSEQLLHSQTLFFWDCDKTAGLNMEMVLIPLVKPLCLFKAQKNVAQHHVWAALEDLPRLDDSISELISYIMLATGSLRCSCCLSQIPRIVAWTSKFSVCLFFFFFYWFKKNNRRKS